jgi:hypothetical protein
MVWPAPATVRLRAFGGALQLPVRPPEGADAAPPGLGEPTWGPEAPTTVLREGAWSRTTAIDPRTGETTVTNVVDGPLVRQDRTGRALALTGWDRTRFVARDPLSVRAESRREFEIVRDGSAIRVKADLALSSTADAFNLDVAMAGAENDAAVFAREWHALIPRDGV